MLTVLAEKLLAAQAGLEQRSRNSVRGLCNHWGGLVWAPREGEHVEGQRESESRLRHAASERSGIIRAHLRICPYTK